MHITLNGFTVELSLHAWTDHGWRALEPDADGRFAAGELTGQFQVAHRAADQADYTLEFHAAFPTRLRLRAAVPGESDYFHLIPANIHGDNNRAHARPNEFPFLAPARDGDAASATLWEFRADRASHPVSILCCRRGAVGLSIAPYSECAEAAGGIIRNGVFAALPDAVGVSVGYGNDPLTFVNKTQFAPATSHLSHGGRATGSLFAVAGDGRREAHAVIRRLYAGLRECPTHRQTHAAALRGLADAFIETNYSAKYAHYTNQRCRVPVNCQLAPWRPVADIGWTAGGVLAYPFLLAKRLVPELAFPKTPEQILDEVAGNFNPRSGLIGDTTQAEFAGEFAEHWPKFKVNGWWSGYLPETMDRHCAYTNGNAAFYLLKCAAFVTGRDGGPAVLDREAAVPPNHWTAAALRVLDTAIELQRADGAFGYLFSAERKEVVDWNGFAGCWFAAALPLAWKLTGNARYLESARRAMAYYHGFVRELFCWGTPMDTWKSVDQEGNLAFIRAARELHAATGDDVFLKMLQDGAHYEYLWRYGFRARPEFPPLKGSTWNSCGGSVTSVSNPCIHPMGLMVTDDLEYLAKVTGDAYHRDRAEDGLAWAMNTLELYPEVVGYGRYGMLSERFCPSDGLVIETYEDTGAPASTWWSYNAWAAANVLEAMALKLLTR